MTVKKKPDVVNEKGVEGFGGSDTLQLASPIVTKIKSVLDVCVKIRLVLLRNVSEPMVEPSTAHTKVVFNVERFIDVGYRRACGDYSAYPG